MYLEGECGVADDSGAYWAADSDTSLVKLNTHIGGGYSCVGG
jgi:hypothetical protein